MLCFEPDVAGEGVVLASSSPESVRVPGELVRGEAGGEGGEAELGQPGGEQQLRLLPAPVHPARVLLQHALRQVTVNTTLVRSVQYTSKLSRESRNSSYWC